MMVALLVSLLAAAGLLIVIYAMLTALEARGALWLDLIVHGARPFAGERAGSDVSAAAEARARRRAAA